MNNDNSNRIQQLKTIPKSIYGEATELRQASAASRPSSSNPRQIMNNRSRNTTKSNNKSQYENDIDHYGFQDMSSPVARKLSSAMAAETQEQQFVKSISARKNFLSHVTIEPLAFLAILALYIEFPSIQDLIYTKICLQVVDTHPNFTLARATSENQLNLVAPATLASSPNFPPTNVQHTISYDKNNNVTVIDFQANHTDPTSYANIKVHQSSNGRIQSLEGATASVVNSLPIFTNSSISAPASTTQTSGTDRQPFSEDSRRDFLCDRLNKTAIPKDVRDEILRENSQFWLRYQLIICGLCVLTCPYWGGVSDSIGRIIPLNIPIIVATVSNLISMSLGLLINLNLHATFQLEWLYVGAVLTGLSGGQAVIIVNSFSFISDNTSIESRSKRVTVLESIFFLSHSAGFYLTKHIMSLSTGPVGEIWLSRHFVAFALCVLLNLFCVVYSICKLRHHKFHRFLNNFERERQESCMGDAMSAPVGSNVVVGTISRPPPLHDNGADEIDDRYNEGILKRNEHLKASGQSQRGADQSVWSTTGSAERLRELTSSTPDDLDGPIARSDKSLRNMGNILTFKYYVETYEVATKPRELRHIILMLLVCGFISALSLAALMSLLSIYLRMNPFNFSTSEYSYWNSLASISRGVALVCLTLCMKFVRAWNVPDPLIGALGFISKAVGLIMISLAQSSSIIYWSLLAFVFSEFSMPPIRSLLSKSVCSEELGKIYSSLAALQSICFLVANIVFYQVNSLLELNKSFRLCFLVVAGLEMVAGFLMLYIYASLKRRMIVV